ncbi:MAG: hypothetical protein QOE93_1099 [Actinomycetota bacterium]|nr:hypothetical protein [Actinomycetota bacterium]
MAAVNGLGIGDQGRGRSYTAGMDPGGLPDLDLRRYLDGLRRRKATVVGVVVLAIATAITLSVLQDPLYSA